MGSRALMYTSKMWKNGKPYALEFLSHLIVGVDVDNLKKACKLSGELSKMVSRKLLIAYDTTRS